MGGKHRGLALCVMFTGALALLQSSPVFTASDAELVLIFETGDDLSVLIGGMYLAPLLGVAFLWFIAVIRDQIGEREDRFFATVSSAAASSSWPCSSFRPQR